MDPISDMLTRIKNAQAAHQEHTWVPFSKVKFRIATLLKDAGYLASVDRKKRKARKAELEWLDLSLKYMPAQTGDSMLGAISGIRIISRPSRHIYTKATEIRPVRSGFGTAVVSTSKGIMTSKEARTARLGGEVMFEIW
jgi:small subunit ribosomal protein S8